MFAYIDVHAWFAYVLPTSHTWVQIKKKHILLVLSESTNQEKHGLYFHITKVSPTLLALFKKTAINKSFLSGDGISTYSFNNGSLFSFHPHKTRNHKVD